MKKPVLLEDLGMRYPTESSKQKKRYGLFKCGLCGTEFKAITAHVNSGHTTSCGCYNVLSLVTRSTTHGFATHRLYKIWKSMLYRCNNPNVKEYKNYGERGIKVCKRWKDIKNFIEDMYPTFKEGLSLDRIHNDEGYCLENCRWTTNTVQTRNTRMLRSTNTSGFRGVSYDKRNKKWVSQITVNLKHIFLGYFNTAYFAAKAYNHYVISNHLEHTLNTI